MANKHARNCACNSRDHEQIQFVASTALISCLVQINIGSSRQWSVSFDPRPSSIRHSRKDSVTRTPGKARQMLAGPASKTSTASEFRARGAEHSAVAGGGDRQTRWWTFQGLWLESKAVQGPASRNLTNGCPVRRNCKPTSLINSRLADLACILPLLPRSGTMGCLGTTRSRRRTWAR